MKLFTTYSRINLLSTVIIFLLASVAFSFLLRYVIINGIDEDLRIEKNEVLSYINSYHSLPPVVEVHDQHTQYQLVNDLPAGNHHIYTKKNHHRRGEDDDWERTIAFGATVNGNNYLITVSKSLEGTDDLIRSIILITVGTIVLILCATFFINRLVLRKLWQPFYNSLHVIQNFTVSNNRTVSFPATKIDEFKLLNQTLSVSVNKAQQDYFALKEFTENASHELQTPLAVVRSKLDLLIQNEALTEPQSTAIQASYEAINNMKRLNESLLLLTKIENRQFAEQATIDIEDLIKNKLSQFEEQWQSMGLEIRAKTNPAVIMGNVQLIDILLNNLFSNATRHNSTNGFIHLQLETAQFVISNSGEAQALDKQQVFNRFYKGNSFTGKHGLGLSIVKQICEVSNYRYSYYFMPPNVHTFVIQWP